MIDLNDPKLNRKKKQKIIRELYDEIEREVSEIKDEIKESSPLSLWWKTPQKQEDRIILEQLRTKETRYADEGWYVKNKPYQYEQDYQEYINILIKSEKAESRGIPNASDKKFDALNQIEILLTCINVEAKIKWIRYVIQEKIFSDELLTRLKLFLYSASDDLNTTQGRILTELCIDNNYQSLSDVLDEELEKNAKTEDKNIRHHIMKCETKELRRLLDIGDPFYVYRGFVVKEDEYVRLGKKSEGDAYWKQNARVGISYSLDRNIAGYFCFWSLTHNEDGVDKGRKIRWTDKIPNYIISKDEMIDEWEKYISDLRDEQKVKPIICKFLIDPTKIKGFHMGTTEAEIMITPEDTIVESYVIPTSKDISTCLCNWRVKNLQKWDDITSIYFNENGVAVMPIQKQDGGLHLIFADGKEINEKIKTIKDSIKESGDTPQGVRWDAIMEEYFKEYSYELPRDELNINPLSISKKMFNVITNKHNVNLKRRRGKVYTWTGTAIKSLKQIFNK